MRQRVRLPKLAQGRSISALAMVLAMLLAQLLLPAAAFAQDQETPAPASPLAPAGESATLGQTVKLIASKDTFISSSLPGENFGNLNNLDAGWYAAYGAVRPMIKFNFSNIPGNAKVYSAQLVMYLDFAVPGNDSAMTLNAARITQDWSEGGATWYNSAGSGGSQYRLGSVSSQPGWASFDLTSQVQSWINGQNNNGIMIIGDETPSLGRARIFRSRHVGGNEPYLLVNYECDTLAPISQLGYIAPTSPANFTVSWSGQDRAPSGCKPTGIRKYHVDYSLNNGGSWTQWKSTTSTSSTFSFPVANGARVDFRVYADDNVGNVEKPTSYGSTIVLTQAPTVVFTPLPPVTNVPNFTINWSATNAPAGVASYDIQYQTNGGAWIDLLMQTNQTAYTFVNAQSGTVYGFRGRARDSAGNVGSYPPAAQTQTSVELYPNARMVPFNPNLINSESPVTSTFTLRWTGSTPPGTTITQYQIYYRFYDMNGNLLQNWQAGVPWQTFDGSTTSAPFPVEQLGLGNGVYQFQATATNSDGKTTPFDPNSVEAAMIVDLGDTVQPAQYMPIIFQQ